LQTKVSFNINCKKPDSAAFFWREQVKEAMSADVGLRARTPMVEA
jgi:hypothetical protein